MSTTQGPLTTKSLGSSGLVQIKILLPTVVDGKDVQAGAIVTVDVNTALNLTGGTNPVAELASPLPAPLPVPPATQTGQIAAHPNVAAAAPAAKPAAPASGAAPASPAPAPTSATS